MVELLRKYYRPLRFNRGVDHGLTSVHRAIESYGLNLDPDYQRGHVWTEEQSGKFIGFILEGGDSHPFICNETGRDGEVCEVVDGKQRLLSIVAWVDGKIPAIMSDGSQVWRNQLTSKYENAKLSMGITFRMVFVTLTRQEVLDLYLRLNRGGTVHSDEEIARVKGLLESEQATP